MDLITYLLDNFNQNSIITKTQVTKFHLVMTEPTFSHIYVAKDIDT